MYLDHHEQKTIIVLALQYLACNNYHSAIKIQIIIFIKVYEIYFSLIVITVFDPLNCILWKNLISIHVCMHQEKKKA